MTDVRPLTFSPELHLLAIRDALDKKMRLQWSVLFALLAASCTYAQTQVNQPSVSTNANRHPVVLISIDGLRGRTLSTLKSKHVNAPNLIEFVENGSVADGLTGVFPTVTYPSHTTLVTGVSPNVHGILGNGLFDPEHNTRNAWYWYARQIERPALWDRAHDAKLVTGSVSWPVTIGAHIDYNFPEYRQYNNNDILPLYYTLSTPGLVEEFEQKNEKLTTTSETDDTRGAMAIFLLQQHHPDLLLVHLIDMDHEQHGHGPDSPEAFTALEHIDAIIGKIRAAAPSGTRFVVVSDHGFLPVSQSLHPNAILESLGLAAPAGKPDQWRIASFGNGASFGLIARDPGDVASIRLATETFERMAKEGNWGIDRVFTGEELQKTGGYRNSFLAVTLKSGYTLGGNQTGAWLTSSGNTRGMHGFLPGDPMMEASFVAFGPGIRKEHLGKHRLVDVAPTVAALLGLPVVPTEGEDILKSDSH